MFPLANGAALLTQVIAEGIGNFRIQKIQQMLTGVHQIDPDAEPGEDAGILRADDPGTIDKDMPRRVVHGQDGIRVVDARMREVHVIRVVGA